MKADFADQVGTLIEQVKTMGETQKA